MQGEGVAHAAHLDALGLHAHAQLGVVADPALDDVRNVLQRLGEVLESVVAERDVVGEVGVVAEQVLGRRVLGQGLGVPRLLVEETREVDVGVGVVTGALVHQGLGPRQVLLPVPGSWGQRVSRHTSNVQ